MHPLVLGTEPAPASPENAKAKLPSKPTSKRGAIVVKSIQPTKDEITSYGIKVRDFAYESTLPPIRPYIRRQILPMPDNIEKRLNDDTDDESDPRPSKKSRLERELTEPSFPPQPQPNPVAVVPANKNSLLGRAHALVDLSQFGAPHGGFNRSITSTPPPSKTTVDNDDGDVPTPVITPQWRDIHDFPTLPTQLEFNVGTSGSNQRKLSASLPVSRNPSVPTYPLKPTTSASSLSSTFSRPPPSSPLHQPIGASRYFLRSRGPRSVVASNSRVKTVNTKKAALAAASRVRKTTVSKRR